MAISARKRGACETHHEFGPLDIAAEPKQIVGGAAWQSAGRTTDAGRICSAQKARRLHRLIRDDPHIGGLAAALQRHRADILTLRHARKATGHDLPTRSGECGEDAQHERPRRQDALIEHGRRRRGERLLRDDIDTAMLQTGQQGGAFLGIQCCAGRKAGTDAGQGGAEGRADQ